MEKLAKAPHLTGEGRKHLENELAQLKTVERERIKNIRDQAEEFPEGKDSNLLQYAKLCESFNESRIQSLEELLLRAITVDSKQIQLEFAVFGTTLLLVHPTQEALKLKLVSVDESDLRAGRLSIESHLGKLLLGKKRGDQVIVNTPEGEFEFVVKELRSE